MRILSLFDGMSCGNIAMINAGVKVDRYVAYEIDKYAIQSTQHNFPYVEQMGDVFKADFTEYKGFDFLIGGSPCTYWSIAQSKNRETIASGIGWELFSQYVRALKEAKPKYFIYENNKSMSQSIRQSITETFGFEPICINSALVSAQNRQRLYWVGIRCGDKYKKADVSQPEDRGILLKDILDGVVGIGRVPNYSTEKSRPLSASYCHKGDGDSSVKSEAFPDNPCKQVFDYVAEPILTSANRKTGKSRTLTAGYTICSQRDLRVNIETDGFCGKQGVAEPINCLTEKGEKAKTLMAGYYKYGTATLITNDGFNGGTTAVAEPVCVAERGRAYRGEPQHYEARDDGKTNVLTSVEKDNRVAEPFQVGALPRPNGELSTSQAFRVYSEDAKAVTIKACGGGSGGKTGLYAISADTESENLFYIPCEDAQSYLSDKMVGYAYKEGTKNFHCKEKVLGDKSCPLTKEHNKRAGTTNYIPQDIDFVDGYITNDGTIKNAKPIYRVKDGQIAIKGKQYPIKLKDGFYLIRKLSVSECKRLQTVPEWYEFPVSDSQAYKCLGNGWTCDVITHLIRSALYNGAEEQYGQLSMDILG